MEWHIHNCLNISIFHGLERSANFVQKNICFERFDCHGTLKVLFLVWMGENTATCDMSCVHVWQSTVLKGWPRNFANRKVLLSFRILHEGNSVSTSASRLLRCKDARTHMGLVNSTPHDHGKKKVCENIDPGAGGPCCGGAWITGIAEQMTPPTLAKHKDSQTWTWKSWLFWCLATFYTFATSKSWEKHSIIFRKKKSIPWSVPPWPRLHTSFS